MYSTLPTVGRPDCCCRVIILKKRVLVALHYGSIGPIWLSNLFVLDLLTSSQSKMFLWWCWQASLWIIIFSYVGNYFWTHYFFTVLGASYTFPSWKMNNVSQGPITYLWVRLHTLYWFALLAGTTHNIPAHSCLLPLLSCCIKYDTAPIATLYCWFARKNSMGYWSCMDSCSRIFYSIPGDNSYFQCMS